MLTETLMSDDYVENRDGGYWIRGTRVSLDSVAYAFLAGQTAEAIAQTFPTLRLEQVYGALTFYLANRESVDRYLRSQHEGFEEKRQAARASDPMFYQKLAATRPKAPATH